MKQPAQTSIVRTRKSLLTRTAHKAGAKPVTSSKRKVKELIDENLERELVKLFSEK